MRWEILLLGIALMGAGCAGIVADDTTNTTGETSTPTVTETPTPTEEPVDPDNPYQSRVIKYTVRDHSDTEISRAYEIAMAVNYWEENSETHAGYPVEFESTPSASTADIMIRFEDSIDECGIVYTLDEPDNLGCAPVVQDASDTNEVVVRIDNSYISKHTTEVLKHELGHVLGLSHDDEPKAVMEHQKVAAPLQQTVNYSVEIDPRYREANIERQLEAAAKFTNEGSNGTLLTNVTMTRVNDRADAFVHFSVDGSRDACKDSLVCVQDNYECATSEYCMSVEVDGDLDEEQNPYEITTSRIKEDQIGYALALRLHTHVFYPHGYIDELPHELNSSDIDPSSDWWR